MCRWGAQANSPCCAAYRIPRPVSLMQQESAKGSGPRGEALEISTVISAWKPSQHYPTHRNKTGLWNSRESASVIYVGGSPYLWVTEYHGDMQSDRLVARNFSCAYLLFSHAYDLMQHATFTVSHYTLLILPAGWVKKITRCWCHALRTDWPHYWRGKNTAWQMRKVGWLHVWIVDHIIKVQCVKFG